MQAGLEHKLRTIKFQFRKLYYVLTSQKLSLEMWRPKLFHHLLQKVCFNIFIGVIIFYVCVAL